LKEVVGFPPTALTPEQTYDLATAAAAAVTGMSVDDVKRLTTAPMEDIPKQERKAEAAKTAAVLKTYDAIRRVNEGSVEADQLPGRTGELVGKPVPVKPQPSESPTVVRMKDRILDLELRGFNKYDIALQLMREHYPMREIVRHLHVSPRRIAELRKGEEKA